jgi:hypothetical protein
MSGPRQETLRLTSVLAVLVIALAPFYIYWLLHERYELASFAFAAIVVMACVHVWLAFVADSSLLYSDLREALTALAGVVPAYVAAALLYAWDILWPLYAAAFIDVVAAATLFYLGARRARPGE